MSRPQSLLEQLDAIEAIADLHTTPAPEPEPRREEPPRRESLARLAAPAAETMPARQAAPTPAAPPVAAPQPAPGSNEALYGLLLELKRDIERLQTEQAPPPRPTGEQQLYALLSELRRDIDTLRGEQTAPARPPQEQHLYGLLAELKRDVEVLRREQTMQGLPPGERELYAMLADLRSDIRVLQGGGGRTASASERYGALETGRRGSRAFATGSWSGIAALVFALALIPAVVGYGLHMLTRAPGAGRGITTASTGTLPQRTAAAPDALSTLFDAFAAADVSPRGTAAAGMSDMRALQKASQLLAADGARDTDEAEFWLKRYLGGTFADRNLMRALTQLGSSYAETSGKPADYVKARYLWEMASAAGDPVAMCFLGRLFENGMGVDANKRTALRLYERAREAGGCTGLEESIARVR